LSKRFLFQGEKKMESKLWNDMIKSCVLFISGIYLYVIEIICNYVSKYWDDNLSWYLIWLATYMYRWVSWWERVASVLQKYIINSSDWKLMSRIHRNVYINVSENRCHLNIVIIYVLFMCYVVYGIESK